MTPSDPFRAYLTRWGPAVEEAIDRLLPSADTEPQRVHAAMRWSVQGGGKRLRPVLVLLGARAAGGEESSVLGVACAVELLHTYSLIHDDLPAMDDDDLRRGRPSCHRRFDEATAILAGDALNTLAFGLLATEAPRADRVGDLVRVLAEASGTGGMVGGQAADLEAEGRPVDEALVRGIHARKTGALLTASLTMGAIAVGAEAPLLRGLSAYGRAMGLAFQIVDDVLDVEGDAASLGKTPGKDVAQGKATYPAAIGVPASRALAASLAAEARAVLPPSPASEVLAALVDYVVERRG